jgi:hypothetical protein
MFVRNLARMAAIGAVAGLALTAASAAGASTSAPVKPAASINGPNYNPIEVGYQQHGSIQKNQMRGTVTIPAGSKVSQFLGLQENVNGGQTFALGLLYNPFQPASKGGPGYELVALHGVLNNFATGTPLGNVSAPAGFQTVATLGTPAGHTLFSAQTGGSYYLEVRLSTLHNTMNYVAGPNENDAATLSFDVTGITADGFAAPFVEGIDFFSFNLPPSTTLASWSRMGTTTFRNGTRVTFDNESLDQTDSLEACFIVGCQPSIANHVTMFPSPALPGVGSAWSEMSGS